MKIMIVDDAVFIRRVLRGILNELGYDVIAEAGSGSEAIRFAEQYKPDVITLDITLPDIDGITTLKRIKEILPDTTVIMVTAISNQSLVMEALKNGADNFINKPFSKEKIESVLQFVKSKIEKQSEPIPPGVTLLKSVEIHEFEDYLTINLLFSGKVKYETERLRTNNGMRFRFKDSILAADIQNSYSFSKIIEDMMFEPNTDGIDLYIKTDSQNISIKDEENSIQFIFRYNFGTVGYDRFSHKIILENIYTKNVEIVNEEKRIIFILKSAALYIDEDVKEIDDDLVYSIEVMKTEKGYKGIVYLKKHVSSEVILGEISSAIIIKTITTIDNFEVKHKDDSSIISLFGVFEDEPILKEDGDVASVEIINSFVNNNLLDKDFNFDEGYIEKIRFTKTQKNTLIIQIKTNAKKILFERQKNRLNIIIRGNKAFVLYDNLNVRLIFQNINFKETKFEYKKETSILYFEVENRFLYITKDDIKPNPFINEIYLVKDKNKYIGYIQFKTNMEIDFQTSNAETLFYVFFTPKKEYNIISKYELHEVNNVTTIKLFGNNFFEKEVVEKEDKSGIILKIKNAKLENISDQSIYFEGCIQKVNFIVDVDMVIVDILSYVDKYEVRDSENILQIDFYPKVVDVNYDLFDTINFSNMRRGLMEFYDNKEENIIEFKIINIKRDITLPLGLKTFEKGLVEHIQIFRKDNEYSGLIKYKGTIKYSVEEIDNNLMLKIIQLNEIKNIIIEGNNVIIEHELNNIIYLLKKENKMKTEIWFDNVIYNYKKEEIYPEKNENSVIQKISIDKYEENKLRLSFFHKLCDVIEKTNDGQLILEFIELTSQIYVQNDKWITIENIDENNINYYFKPTNNILVVEIPKATANFKDTTVNQLSDKINEILIIEEKEKYRIFVLFNSRVNISEVKQANKITFEFAVIPLSNLSDADELSKHPTSEKEAIMDIDKNIAVNFENHKEVKLDDKPVIYIDAGHGGNNFGSIFEKIEGGRTSRIYEKDLCLDLSLRLKKLLDVKGFYSKLTREKDENVPQNERLGIIKQRNNSILISFHIGSSSNKNIRGILIYYNKIENGFDSKRLGEFILENIRKSAKIPVKDLLDGKEISFIRNSGIPSLIIQVGYGTNLYDLMLLSDDKFKNEFCKILTHSIEEYISSVKSEG